MRPFPQGPANRPPETPEDFEEGMNRARATREPLPFLRALIRLIESDASLSTEEVRARLSRLGTQIAQENSEIVSLLKKDNANDPHITSSTSMIALGKEMQVIAEDNTLQTWGAMARKLEELAELIARRATETVRTMGRGI
ncbi:MAG: hypothetical protein WBK28_01930 [Minisyncoccia bacterium]